MLPPRIYIDEASPTTIPIVLLIPASYHNDSINGIISSHAAGLYTIMVIDLIQPNDEAKEAADQIYDSLFEVKALLESGRY